MAPRPLAPDAAARPTTAGALLAAAAERLRGTSPTPRLDAELLVSHAVGRDRAWLHAHPEAALDSADASRLASWVDRRADDEPIAYIRGFKEWLSLRVATDRRALIPRPETEVLAEAAMAEIASRLGHERETTTFAWEVGTGSGAIALAVGRRFREDLSSGRLRLAATDLSPDALALAAENLMSGGLEGLVSLDLADLLELPGSGAPLPDVVIANLPYVPSAEVAAANGSLRYEPRAALDGGADGLDVVRRLVSQLPVAMAAGGTALLEIGAGQAAAVRDLVAQTLTGATVSTLGDLSGIERVVRIAHE